MSEWKGARQEGKTPPFTSSHSRQFFPLPPTKMNTDRPEFVIPIAPGPLDAWRGRGPSRGLKDPGKNLLPGATPAPKIDSLPAAAVQAKQTFLNHR